MSIEKLIKKYQDYIQTGDVERPKSWFSLGPLSVNLAVGDPRGVQSGRIVQIVGKQSSGKSTLALEIARQYQEDTKLPVLYVDFERAYDRNYARSIGVNIADLLMVRPDTTEIGMNIIEDAIKESGIKLVIIDSIAAAMPSTELQKDYDDAQKMAGNATIITRFCNRIVPVLDNYDTLLVVLNQNRKNFSTLSKEDEVPFGGTALQYATSVTLQVTRIETKENYQTTQVIIKKNRTNAPQGRAAFRIDYGKGINAKLDIFELALARGWIEKSGAWYTYKEFKGQGKENASESFPIDELRQRLLEN